MKAHLLFRDADLDPTAALPAQSADLIRDLGLDTVFAAMTGGDKFLDNVARQVLLNPLAEPDRIGYRQAVLADALTHTDILRRIYDLAVEAAEQRRQKAWFFWRSSPETVLHHAVTTLEMYVGVLAQLRAIAAAHAARFGSEGFRTFFAMIASELDDDYFAVMREHVNRLQFKHGVPISARLGQGNKSVKLTVRVPWTHGLWQRLTGGEPRGYTVIVPERDEGGAREVEAIKNVAVNEVANALAQACDHIGAFLAATRAEIAFYLGCVNLHRRLTARGLPACVPQVVPLDRRELAARGVYDVALALRTDAVVGNDVDADGAGLIVVTGANSGGKSTFLRSVGIAQLMAAAGMFGPATALRCGTARGVFTHFKREEDATMEHGKLDEELTRMRTVADTIEPGCLLLLNESFASTNEREGAEIAEPVLRALLETGVRIVMVTHSYELARRCDDLSGDRLGDVVYLRAERLDDGRRTFRMAPGRPLATSYGADLYRQVFAGNADSG